MELNPKFVFFSPVRDRVIPSEARNPLLRHGDLADHIDHAIIALDGRAPLGGEYCIEALAPLADSESLVRVELWVNAIDDYTCTYGFLCSSEDGRVPHARGERSVVNIDPASHSPAPWPRDFRTTHAELLKDLPAYA